MKKLFPLLLLLMMLAPAALAEQGTVSFLEVTVPTDCTYVDLGAKAVRDLDALEAFLDQLPQVTQVDMYATKMKRDDCDRLAQRYPQITFGWTLSFGDHTLRTDATAFSTLHNNKSPTHSSQDFSILKYCKNLQALDIGHNKVDDLTFLYDLPHLKVLILACNAVTDITPLSSLPELEYLELFKNKITDLTPLSGLTRLKDLNICFNKVKDYAPLTGLTQLERLWIYNSDDYSDTVPLPKSVVSMLKDALPDTHIDSTHYSTLGGWREHPRYDVIYKMFSGTEYIPFDAEEAAVQ